jgi:hypothetical protein
MWVLPAIAAGKFLLYWLCVYLFFHRMPLRRHAELPPARRAFFSALLRVSLGIGVGLPLGFVLLQRDEYLILAGFGLFRFGAWLASVWWYQRPLPGAPVLFALAMTAINFVVDLAIMGNWLPSVLSAFSLC